MSHDQSAKWFSRSATQNKIQAQYDLAINFKNGKGVPQDDNTAFLWFQKAALNGHAAAKYNLGLMYYGKDDDNGNEDNQQSSSNLSFYGMKRGQRRVNGIWKNRFKSSYYEGQNLKQHLLQQQIQDKHKERVAMGVPPWNGQWQKHHWGFKPGLRAPNLTLIPKPLLQDVQCK